MSEDVSGLHFTPRWVESAAVHVDDHHDGSDRLAAEIAALRAEVSDLRRALASRATIEQAKGILMHRFGFGPETAFAVLKRVSQDNNVRLREVARALVTAAQGAPTPSPTGPEAVVAARLLDGHSDGWSADPERETQQVDSSNVEPPRP